MTLQAAPSAPGSTATAARGAGAPEPSAQLWIGIDPGTVTTGITARYGRDLAGWTLVEHAHRDSHAQRVRDVLTAALAHGPARVAVEDVVPPSWHINGQQRPLRPGDLIGPAVLVGAVLAAWPDAVVVRPGGHGQGALRAYPPGLVSDAERRRGLDRPAGRSSHLRHARSAWDIAGAAITTGRTTHA